MSDAHELDHDLHSDVDYERSDVNLKQLMLVALVSVVILGACLILLDDIFTLWKEADKQKYVYSVQSSQLREIHAKENELLHNYAVVDSVKHKYRIPISEAMRLMVEEAYTKTQGSR